MNLELLLNLIQMQSTNKPNANIEISECVCKYMYFKYEIKISKFSNLKVDFNKTNSNVHKSGYSIDLKKTWTLKNIKVSVFDTISISCFFYRLKPVIGNGVSKCIPYTKPCFV